MIPSVKSIGNVPSSEFLRSKPVWIAFLHRGENALIIAALGAMMILPLVEILLRAVAHTGLPASVPIVQHLVLAVGMLGGALAARENRLLVLSTATQWFKGGLQTSARLVGSSVAAAICAILCLASWRFILSSRQLGRVLAYGIPVWVVQLLLVIGFGLIAIRLIWHSSAVWRGRSIALVIAASIIALAAYAPVDPALLRWPALGLLAIAVVCGAPIFTALSGAAVILFWSAGEPISPVPLKHYQLTVNPTLPSIPLFTLAGYFLASGNAAKRLVRLFAAFFSNVRGGPAIVTTLVCAFFTSFTGASGVTILALGGLLMPVLISARYTERNALGLLTGAGSLGMLFPPCLPPILYAVIASSGGLVSVSIADMFKGGLIPGLILVGLTAWWGIHQCPPAEVETRRPFDQKEAWAAIWGAKWELLVPVVALTALFGGYATPVEAAALTAFYTFIVNVAIHRDLKLVRDVPGVITECGLLVGGVLLILGVALGFTHYLIDAQIPDAAVDWTTSTIKSKLVFLLCLNVVLLVVGGLVEIYAAIIVVVPLLVPLGIAYGIDPVHLGIIFLCNMELGFLAPPIGLNLLLAAYRFDKPISEITRASLPMLAVMIVGVLLITYIPALSTGLVHLWK